MRIRRIHLIVVDNIGGVNKSVEVGQVSGSTGHKHPEIFIGYFKDKKIVRSDRDSEGSVGVMGRQR